MSQKGPLPPEVEPVIAAYRDLLHAEGVPELYGLYLTGSIALGDFRPATSDIDFIALLGQSPSDDDTNRLAWVHARLAQTGGPHFDGVYLPAALLQQPAPGEAWLPFSVEGVFHTDRACSEANPAVWRCLARHGRTIFGLSPVELGIADDEEALRAHQIANLEGYWRSWIAQAQAALDAKAPGEDCNAAALAWGVLGVGRSVHTLTMGNIVTKAEGGRFGIRSYPAAWHPIIEQALAIHDGGPPRASIASLREALAYMRFVIATATSDRVQPANPSPSP